MVANKNMAQVALFSTLLVMIPLFVFPDRFGLELHMGMFTYAIIEIFFYAGVFFAFRSESSFLEIAQGVGLAFLYRFVMGSVFGLLIWVVYHIDFSVALSLGISRYLPVVIIQALATPFVLKSTFMGMVEGAPMVRRHHDITPRSSNVISESFERPKFQVEKKENRYKAAPVDASTTTSSSSEEYDTGINLTMNGFERSVRYLGEHHAVELAAVVDSEGLPMAVFKRGDIDADRWTPMAGLFTDANESLLNRGGGYRRMDQFSLTFDSNRLVMVRINSFNLLVLSHQGEDDLLQIRIAQASDVIRKYSSERYSELLAPSTEEQEYVSGS